MIKEMKYNGNKEEILNLLAHRFEIDEKYDVIVKDIIKNVRENGDKALVEYTQKFDSKSFEISNLIVTREEIDEAYKKVDSFFIESITKAKENIENFHKRQVEQSWNVYGKEGEILGVKVTPLKRVGIYVPGGKGGTTPLVSTLMMTSIPAKTAGVSEIAMITPPNDKNEINPYMLVTADIAGVTEIYKTASAWGIAALAYGTETIKPVNKIVGPGNIYVTVAKKNVYGKVDIDMIAGPSEVLIIADKSADPSFLAADMLAQAEHDIMAASILITDSVEIVENTKLELAKQLKVLDRNEIAQKSIIDNGMIILVDKMDDAFNLSNEIAPEHLELQIENPFESLSKVENAGAVFLGKYSPEPLGDYFAGPNHVLPTNNTAKFYSPLSVDDFIKKTSIIYYPEKLLLQEADKIIKIAEVEGLTAHANSVRIRKK